MRSLSNQVAYDAQAGSGGAGSGDIAQLTINTIRTLSMDAVQKANSGHPGTAMALAPAMYALWQHELKYDPQQPLWPARDRFVLSIGHASVLLYSTIFLTGIRDIEHGKVVDRPSLTVKDIEQFRQLSSKTPGHPEYRFTSGVETTTGPLGQGCGNSVGMAIAEKHIQATYGRPGFEDLFSHYVYAFCGDGDMMEGVASEAASTAGHLGLGNLIWLYDSNQISIEGSTEIAFTEDVGKRFEGYKWHVQTLSDANDVNAIRKALEAARQVKDRPSLIILKTVIGYGAPKKAGTAAAHGEPLGAEEIAGAKKAYGWPSTEPFYVPDGVQDHFKQGLGKRGAEAYAAWTKKFTEYTAKYPDEAEQLKAIFEHRLPKGWDQDLPKWEADPKGVASRASSGKVINAIAKNVPWMIGGSADLSPSTKTNLTFDGAGSFQPAQWNGSYAGRNLHFGVREHAMGAICNGIALSGIRPYCSGFLIFSDYMKAPIRLSAIMELPVIYIFTHDSIGVGEDGPTHQPIEQLAQLRATPGLMTIRPADANEVDAAWRTIMPLTEKPAVLILSRQNLPTIDRSKYAPAENLSRGAYVLACCGSKPDVILMASGSEVGLVVEVYEKLIAEGVKARVVSFPSFDLFEEQEQAYKDSVLPPDVKGRVAVEQAAAFGWDRYAGPGGDIIAMNSFGASAPLSALLTKFGFTPEKVYEAALKQSKRK